MLRKWKAYRSSIENNKKKNVAADYKTQRVSLNPIFDYEKRRRRTTRSKLLKYYWEIYRNTML
jgi:hypothetical protein